MDPSPVKSCRRRSGAGVALLAALVALVAAPLPAQDCRRGDRPVATLLFPYFEVDLAGSRTTLIAIGTLPNPLGIPALAHVTVWTDWGIPTVTFDLYLRSGDIQTINLRDLLATGRAPNTGPVPSAVFPTCAATLGGFRADPALLQLAHTGRSTLGSCLAGPRFDPSLATGYITVDNALRCPSASTTPASPGYFTGGSRVASTDNVLWGDFVIVDPTQNFASGQTAVHIVADPVAFGPGDYTFYGKYVDFDGSDERTPLANRWGARYLLGGAFDGGTQLLVWRDNRDPSISARPCGTLPAWGPLRAQNVIVRDEGGSVSEFHRPLGAFPWVTQRVDLASALMPLAVEEESRDAGVVTAPILPLPPPFGWIELRLDHEDGTDAQAWVGWVASAENRYASGLAGVPLTNPCALVP